MRYAGNFLYYCGYEVQCCFFDFRARVALVLYNGKLLSNASTFSNGAFGSSFVFLDLI